MSVFKSFAAGALFAVATVATPALAEGLDSGVKPEVLRFDTTGNVIVHGRPHGGGVAWITGSGDDYQLHYADTPMLSQSPAIATMTGSGDDWVITYQTPAETSRMAVGASQAVGPRG